MWRYFFWEENRKWRWRFCIGALIFITSVICLQPLKGDIITYDYGITYYIIGYTIISFNFFIFIFLLPKIIPKFFAFENWTFKRFTIWFVVFVICVSISSFFCDVYYQNVEDIMNWGFKYYVSYQIPILVFIVVSLLFFFVVYDPNPTKQIEAENNQAVLGQKISFETTQEIVLEVKDTNNRVELNIFLNELYFFKASDNYIEIFHKNTEGVNRTIIRNTLKDIENQFLDIPQMFRCHKAFIVNTEKVKEVSGNAKGYFLTLEDVSDKIPVSRSNIEAMKKCLTTFFE
jgi:LytTr DNA-binding domain